MEKPPSIAEILELEQVLHIMRINELDAGMRDLRRRRAGRNAADPR